MWPRYRPCPPRAGSQAALFKRSPCGVPPRDPTLIDPSLPPGRDETRTVAAKPQNTVNDYRHWKNYPTTHRSLTLHDAGGGSQTLGDISEGRRNSVPIGGPVSVTLWRGETRRVSALGSSSRVSDPAPSGHLGAGLWPWLVAGLVGSSGLFYLWGGRGRRVTAFDAL